MQGLALGGEYGGAATYVAEHAAQNQRGYDTSWIQTTATLGFFLALAVIGICRFSGVMDPKDFTAWGWRIPFLVSLILLIFSVYIRLKLNESPVFQRMKAEGKGSKSPLRDSFLKYPNNKYVLLALLGATAGQGVVWYTGQFYALFFLTITLKMDGLTAYTMIGLALLDRHAVLHRLRRAVGPDRPTEDHSVRLPDRRRHLFPAVQGADALRQSGVGDIPDGEPDECCGGTEELRVPHLRGPLVDLQRVRQGEGLPDQGGAVVHIDRSAGGLRRTRSSPRSAIRSSRVATTRNTAEALKAAGYPASADKSKINYPMTMLILVIMMIYVTLVYGPIAAFLVELFPTRIRYTSMSLPYHIGNGWFGGMLPLLATAMVAASGDIYFGLWYPIVVALMTFVVGLLFLRDHKDRDIESDWK